MDSPAINEETVEALLETVRKLAEAEEGRGQSFNQRAGWLLGFSGVILTLAVGQAREIVESDLGEVGRPLAASLVGLAALLIVIAAERGIRVMRPRDLWHIKMQEIEQYASREVVTTDRVMVQGRTMRGLIRQMGEERVANNAKAEYFRAGVGWLLAGLGTMGASVGVFIVRALGV